MADPAVSWLVIIIFLLLHFFFSAAETAIACCNRFKMQVKADEGSKTAKTLLKIIDKYDRALTTVLIGNNIVAIGMSAVSTVLFLNIFKNSGITEYSISLISSIIMTFLVYVLGDTLPKTIARNIPDTLSLIFTYPVRFMMIIFFPISWCFEMFAKGISKLFHLDKEENITENDLEEALEEANKQDVIDEDQIEIVTSAMDYLDTTVKEVLTPREKIFAINIKDLTHESLQKILLTSKYSRIPVYDKVFDNMVGVLHIKIYFEEYEKDPHVDIRSILQKPYFVTSKVMIDDLFNGFKRHRTHLALVRDDHKKIIGMVTMEDILEEIVSDIGEPASPRRRKA